MAYNIYTNHFHGRETAQLPRIENRKTTDKAVIKNWAEARRGVPVYKQNGSERGRGILRICFRISPHSSMHPHIISWDTFFRLFEEQQLALVYQEKKYNGDKSIYCELVSRN